MKTVTIAWISYWLVLSVTAYAAGRSNIQSKQIDGQHLMVSCANGADPAIKGADQYNTIVVTCTDERK